MQSIIGIVLTCHLGINWCVFGFPLFKGGRDICLSLSFFVLFIFLVSLLSLKKKGTCSRELGFQECCEQRFQDLKG